MIVKIRSEKLEITEAMREYAEEKMNKLSRYLDNQDSLIGNLLFKVNGPIQKLEITIPLKNFTLRAEEENKDFYAAVDVAIDKLQRQIIKNKTKLTSKKMKGKKDFIFEEFDDDDDEINDNKIVKRKYVELKPIDEEEAILQMELLNHDFYVFKNIDTNKVAVLYRRKNNDYGLIEEE